MTIISGLDGLISLDTPAIDPIIIDWKDKRGENELASEIHRIVSMIILRIFASCATNSYEMAIVSSPKIVDYLRSSLAEYRLVQEKHAGNVLYIITKSIGNRAVIHPPYTANGIMSWEEYLSRLSQGDKLNIMIDAPWAQAKIINISTI